jgi:hypothetical protein
MQCPLRSIQTGSCISTGHSAVQILPALRAGHTPGSLVSKLLPVYANKWMTYGHLQLSRVPETKAPK